MVSDFIIGASQIIRDTLGGGGSRQCHQMPHGGGGAFAKVSRDIFIPNFGAIFTCFVHFLGH